jgi:hypothetical protein
MCETIVTSAGQLVAAMDGGTSPDISQNQRIGAPNQRKWLCSNNFALIRERPDADGV